MTYFVQIAQDRLILGNAKLGLERFIIKTFRDTHTGKLKKVN